MGVEQWQKNRAWDHSSQVDVGRVGHNVYDAMSGGIMSMASRVWTSSGSLKPSQLDDELFQDLLN